MEQIIHIIHIRFRSHTVIDLSLGSSKKSQKSIQNLSFFLRKEPRITQNARITSAMSDGELIMSGMNSRFLEKEKVGELVATGWATFGDKFANLCENVPE